MPGNTENTDILAGLNEIVEAINSLNKPTEADGLIVQLVNVAQQLTDMAQIQLGIIGAIQNLVLTCNTTVNTTNLTQTISCGESGSRGAGTWPEPESPQTTTPEDEAGDPPPGFESWSEFRQYQCDMAYLILEQMVDDLAGGSILAATYATVATLAPILIVALLTPIGWAEIIIIAGLWITIWAAGVNVALLSQILIDNQEEFVCELLSGTSVSSSISAFGNLVSSKVDGEATLGALPELIRNQVKNLMKSYASIDSINRLYEKAPVPPPGQNDCSGCDEEETGPYTVLLGEETSDNPANPITGVMQYNEFQSGCGTDEREFQVNFHQAVTITNVTNTGSGACGSVYIHNYFSNEDFTGLITQLNGRPQDTAPVSGVRSMYIVTDAEGGDPTISITYTLD